MSDIKLKDGLYKIRPAGRHILTIGRDLIKDKYAAIVELVKNSYDADSLSCTVSLMPFERKFVNKEGKDELKKGITITITDEGHGMTFETVTEKWMVPSTEDKVHRITSPEGRIMQGKKGIGRYSASLLGDDLVLQTIHEESKTLTSLYLIWDNFKKADYLDDVDVLIENFETDKTKGTEIVIVGDEKHLEEWTEKQLKNLKSELKKLIPPIDRTIHNIGDDTDNFKITLKLGNFPYKNYTDVTEQIEPYPLFDLYDYRISGVISKEGVAKLQFENKRINAPIESIEEYKILLNTDKDKEYQSYCGTVNVDFRVFDRDPTSIDALIERGLKDPVTGDKVGKREARLILDTFNGVGVYRQGFRLRPLGDAGYDWLSLDNQRVQNPSLRIGSDQIIGFIHIESEEKSNLEEKSARDGLKENSAYFGLEEIAKQVLKELEIRRFTFRKKVGLGRSKRNVDEKIEKLYNFKELRKKIDKELDSLGVAEEKRKKIGRLISDKEEASNKVANELKQIIALYQGQATLGKIVNVILHEGRKPLGYFKNQIPLVSEWRDELNDSYNEELFDKIIDRLGVIKEQGEIFTNLFSKLDPLSAKRRRKKKDFEVKRVIDNTKDVFLSELDTQNISLTVSCDANQTIYGWEEDFYIIFTNLVDNSIYWLQSNITTPKEINFKVYEEDDLVIIEYRDNGPGIEKELIESEVIFEPEFSNKLGGGTGLGLAIAGEAISRNYGELKAIYSEEGAYFKIEIQKQ